MFNIFCDYSQTHKWAALPNSRRRSSSMGALRYHAMCLGINRPLHCALHCGQSELPVDLPPVGSKFRTRSWLSFVLSARPTALGHGRLRAFLSSSVPAMRIRSRRFAQRQSWPTLTFFSRLACSVRCFAGVSLRLQTVPSRVGCLYSCSSDCCPFLCPRWPTLQRRSMWTHQHSVSS